MPHTLSVRPAESKRAVNPLAPAGATLFWVPETLFHCAGICLGDLRNRQAQSHSADDRSSWMLENPAFQFSRFPEVAVIGELQVQNAACTVAELPIGNLLECSLAPSRINRPGRIPVQTADEKWTTQDYRCVQRDGANFGTLTRTLDAVPFGSLPESPARFHLQTPNTDTAW